MISAYIVLGGGLLAGLIVLFLVIRERKRLASRKH